MDRQQLIGGTCLAARRRMNLQSFWKRYRAPALVFLVGMNLAEFTFVAGHYLVTGSFPIDV
jgi:hypothetical protein